MAKLRVIFAGTPEFAAAALASLLDYQHVELVAAYTQPDKPAGRGQQLRQSAVKQLALSHGLHVVQPVSLREAGSMENLAAWRADLLIVAAYGQILPRAVLDTPRLGTINVHASLLPRWRGAAPIQRALMAGDTETGITIMRVVEKLDAGPMLLARRCAIAPDETGGSLHDRLALLGGEALREALDQILAGPAVETPQNEAEVTYARKIGHADRVIDWNEPAVSIERLVRALAPAPLATAQLKGLDLNIVRASLGDAGATLAPGEFTECDGALYVGTGSGALRLLAVQPAGKARMEIREFLNGYRTRLSR